jgi:hypothetical protein
VRGSGGVFRRLHYVEFHNLYASPNTTCAMKLRRMRWAGHVSRMGRWEMHTKFLSENLNRRDYLEGRGVDATISECILRKQGERVWTGCILHGIGTRGRLLWTRKWTFGVHTRKVIPWPSEWLCALTEICSSGYHQFDKFSRNIKIVCRIVKNIIYSATDKQRTRKEAVNKQ